MYVIVIHLSLMFLWYIDIFYTQFFYLFFKFDNDLTIIENKKFMKYLV